MATSKGIKKKPLAKPLGGKVRTGPPIASQDTTPGFAKTGSRKMNNAGKKC